MTMMKQMYNNQIRILKWFFLHFFTAFRYEDGDDDMKRTIAKAWTESRDKQSGEIDKLGL